MEHLIQDSNDSTRATFFKSLRRSAALWTPALFALPLLSAGASAQTCLTGNLLSDAQFAFGTSLGNYGNTAPNQWYDEQATITTTTVGGVSPATPGGSLGMLQFDSVGGVVSQTRQFVSVAAYSAEINAGTLAVIASATYNTPGAGPVGGFSVSTWDGTTLTPIPGGSGSLATDASPATWETLEVCVQVPTGTTTLCMDLWYTNISIPNDDGFIDEASLQLSSVANDSCDKPRDVSNLGSFNFDTTCATTDGFGSLICDSFGQSNIENDLWFKWTAPANGDFLFSTCGTTWDTKIAVYADESAGGGSTCPTLPPLCCNDDACGLQAELCCPGLTQGTSYIIRVGNFPGASPAGGIGNLTFAMCVPPPSDCFDYWCFGDGSTVSPCPCGGNYSSVGDDAGCLNSTGQGAILRGFGSCSLSVCDLTITLSQLPPNQFGIIFSGLNQTDVVFGDGVRCVAGSIIRSQAMNSGANGTFSIPDALCTSGLFGQFPAPGQTRHLQGWYRDPALLHTGYNVSNAMSVTITP